MNIREEYSIMPIGELKKYYKRVCRKFRFLACLPCVVVVPSFFVYGFLGWVSFFVSESTLFMSGINLGGSGAADYIVFAICGAILLSHSKRSNNEALYVMGAFILLRFLFRGEITIISIVMLCYILAVRVPLEKLNSTIEFMRTIPTFPFNERVSNAMFNQHKFEKQEKIIRNAMGITVSYDYDKLLDKNYKPPELSEEEKETFIPDDYFQKHKMYLDGKVVESTLTENEIDRQRDADGVGLEYKHKKSSSL